MADTVAETTRLRLRTWDEFDSDAFYAVMNTQGVMRYLGGVQTADQWRAAYERLQSYHRDYGFTFWLVEARTEGSMLGFCGLKRVNYAGAPNPGAVEIGWRLRESAWGQGIAAEAATAALNLAFNRFGALDVVAITAAANVASQRLMERLGMRYDPSLDFADPRYPNLNPMKQWRVDRATWSAR